MANPEHLEILKQGVETWNEWRLNNSTITPDLRFAVLSGVDLTGADLRGADLLGANLLGTVFTGTKLRGADLTSANLTGTKLRGADLTGVDLVSANLVSANLFGANLTGVDLAGANLTGADLTGADLTSARLVNTTFANNDLSEVKGFETIDHVGPSTVGIDTIYKSRGKIPEVFLRGCGLPESFIIQIPALIAAMQPIQFYSCFISY